MEYGGGRIMLSAAFYHQTMAILSKLNKEWVNNAGELQENLF